MSHEFSILPVHLAVKAMRDSGYRNAAYALAELIDNAIQAGAHHVEVICREEDVFVGERTRRRLSEVGVLDNGSGMSESVLRAALQFGNGQYLEDRSGIGRFGMGLPSSSMSQAKRVDVWTWRDGVDEAIHTYLDLDEIQHKDQVEVPEAKHQRPPKAWLGLAEEVGETGTLVVWSKIDRCAWKTARALLSNSEALVGRIYRRFVASHQSVIRMVSVAPDGELKEDYHVRPNDPLYLMTGTSCPWPQDATDPEHYEAMFEAYGEPVRFEVKDSHGSTHDVKIRYSYATNEARGGVNPGAKPHGRHASHNIGVSVMRADRELELQVAGWTIGYNPVERWWGCEVDIPTSLDETFGVTNNKQSATALAEIASLSDEQIAEREGYTSMSELLEAWQQEGDTRIVLVRIKQNIESQLSTIRTLLTAQTRGQKSGQRTRHANSPEARGTEATRQRQDQGYKGGSDTDEDAAIEDRVRAVAEDLVDAGVEETEAEERATEIIVQDMRKYEFVHRDMEGAAFFSVRPKGGVLLIQLNVNHPAYTHLVALLEDDPEQDDIMTLRSKMEKCYDGLKLLLEAWARYEDELPPERKDLARDSRADWGRIAREFMRDD